MLSNLSEFEVLLERYDDDPGVCSKLLRKHSVSHPKTFLEYVPKALLERPVSRALKFIVQLAMPGGLIESLLDLFPRAREDAVAIAKKVTACDLRFDYMLFRLAVASGAPKTAGEFSKLALSRSPAGSATSRRTESPGT